ncbi:MAG: hypothetical protein Q4Q17_02795 [Tissierellia bacterium]|nr:hypothetical protein [Tissierellia bacterium]
MIAQLESGDLSKSQFLRENFNYLDRIGAKPFTRIDSMEKGMFNYQYHNIMAKYYLALAEDTFKRKKHAKVAHSLKQKAGDQYHKKNVSISRMLALVEYQNVDAYFIKAKSKRLNGKLYEIVFYDYKEAIFHSTCTWLLEQLKDQGCFIDGKVKSLIDDYINTKY